MLPVPATEASKLFPLTPEPVYVPPDGVPPLKAKDGVFKQTALNEPKLTTGKLFTVTDSGVEVEVQPLLAVVLTV